MEFNFKKFKKEKRIERHPETSNNRKCCYQRPEETRRASRYSDSGVQQEMVPQRKDHPTARRCGRRHGTNVPTQRGGIKTQVSPFPASVLSLAKYKQKPEVREPRECIP